MAHEAPCEPVEVIILNYKKDGTPFWNLLNIIPIMDDTGRAKVFLGTHEDVTDIVMLVEGNAIYVDEKVVDVKRVAFNKLFSLPLLGKRRGEREPPQDIFAHPNPTLWNMSCCEKLKHAIMFPIVVVRLALMALVVSSTLIWAAMFSCLVVGRGLRPLHAVSRVEQILGYFMLAMHRFSMLSAGCYWVEERGRCCYHSDAPVIVSNHCNMWDGVFFGSKKYPNCVASAARGFKTPIMGMMLRAGRGVLIKRDTREERCKSLQRIVEHVNTPGAPTLVIFPEGAMSASRQIFCDLEKAGLCMACQYNPCS